MPKISIVTTTYNRSNIISRAIESVLNQTFRDFELIIVDDGSTDNTKEVIENFQKKDERIKFLSLKENSGGPAKPRNLALKNCKGEYISFLDSDDMYLSGNLKVKSKILNENPEIEMVNGWSWVINEKSKKIIDCWMYSPLNWLVRKKLFEEVGCFKEEQTGEEEIGWELRYRKLRFSQNLSPKVCILKEPYTLYFRSPHQYSEIGRTKESCLTAQKWLSFLKDIDDSERFKTGRAVILSRVANLYCLGGEIKAGKNYFYQSLKLKFNWFSAILLLSAFVSFEKGKIYRKIEHFLRTYHHLVLWNFRKNLAQIKYKKSYEEAIKLLKSL